MQCHGTGKEVFIYSTVHVHCSTATRTVRTVLHVQYRYIHPRVFCIQHNVQCYTSLAVFMFMMPSVILTALLVFACAISSSTAFSLSFPLTTKQRNVIGSITCTSNAPILMRKGRRVRLCVSAKDDGNEGNDDVVPSFFIREAQEQDLGAVANILADIFFDFNKKPNFIAERVIRMNGYLDLKSRFETFRYAERSGALQCMLVACCNEEEEEEVVAFCEVDNRPPGGEINPAPRPYISNLAVQDSFRRRGVATALVRESEDIVRNSWGEPRLHLRVEQDNLAAKALYQEGCGYAEMDESKRVASANGETVLLLGKKLL